MDRGFITLFADRNLIIRNFEGKGDRKKETPRQETEYLILSSSPEAPLPRPSLLATRH